MTPIINLGDRIVVHATGGDDTANITFAIATAKTIYSDTVPVILPDNLYKTTGIALNAYTKLIGYGSVIAPFSGNGPYVSIPSTNQLQTDQYGKIEGIVVKGANGANGAEIGFSIGDHASYVIEMCTANNCWLGWELNGPQFCTTIGLKAYKCGVGVWLHSMPRTGGANSLSFYDAKLIENIVGAIMTCDPSFGFGDVIFRHLIYQGNACAGFAVFGSPGAGPGASVLIDGGGSEYLGTITSYSFSTPKGVNITVPNCSMYASNAEIRLRNWNLEENGSRTNILAVNGSIIALQDVAGGSVPYYPYVSCDATSEVQLSGKTAISGSLPNVSSVDGGICSNWGMQFGAALPPHTYIDETVPNLVASPQYGDIVNVIGALSNTFGVDPVFGQYQQIGLPTNGNECVWYAIPEVGRRIAMAFNICSDRDALIDFSAFSNQGPSEIVLRSRVWRRILWVHDGVNPNATPGATQSEVFSIKGGDNVGAGTKAPKVSFCLRRAGPGAELTDQSDGERRV